MPARVVCLSPFSEQTLRALVGDRPDLEAVLVQEPPPAPEAVRVAVAGADVLISDKRHLHRVDRPVLEAMAGCRLIQVPAVGFDTVDHRAAAELGIPVANAAGYNKESVADWTVMAILGLIRNSFWGDRQLRAGRWMPGDPIRLEMIGRELGGLTIGIIGLGNVGSAVAKRLDGFGPRVVFTDVVAKELAGARQVDVETLLHESDVVCIHTPLDVDTKGLIDAAALSKMKRGAFLVNAARGPIVDEQALIGALRSGHLGGAALDVFEAEPRPLESALRTIENVILAPHVGGATLEADARLEELVSENLLRILDGLSPPHVVNATAR